MIKSVILFPFRLMFVYNVHNLIIRSAIFFIIYIHIYIHVYGLLMAVLALQFLQWLFYSLTKTMLKI